MAITTAISARPRKNEGSTIVKAGNVASTDLAVNNRTLMQQTAVTVEYGSKVVLAVSPTSSGNLGTAKGLTSGTFARPNEKGVYIARRMATTINGTANTVLYSGGSDFGGARPINSLTSTRRLHETSWDYVTGRVTKGANAGNLVSFGNDDAATPTNAVPGEIVYKTGAIMPVQDDLKPRTNP